MTAMMTVTCQMTLMKLRISFDAGVRCIFVWNSRLSRKWYNVGTDPVNIKPHVMRVSQHQLSFLSLLINRPIVSPTTPG